MKRVIMILWVLIFGISFGMAQSLQEAAEAQRRREAVQQQAAEQQRQQRQQAAETLKQQAEAQRKAEEEQRLAAEAQRLREQETLYRDAIASAQTNLGLKQYAQARQDYVTALQIKPEEAASINPKIEEIDRKLSEPVTLHIYRMRQLRVISILPIRYDVVLDNTVMANTTGNWKTTVQVTGSGKKTLSATIGDKKTEVEVDIIPGDVYYLRCSLESDAIDTGKKDADGKPVKDIIYTPILQLVNKNVGEEEFNRIK